MVEDEIRCPYCGIAKRSTYSLSTWETHKNKCYLIHQVVPPACTEQEARVSQSIDKLKQNAIERRILAATCQFDVMLDCRFYVPSASPIVHLSPAELNRIYPDGLQSIQEKIKGKSLCSSLQDEQIQVMQKTLFEDHRDLPSLDITLQPGEEIKDEADLMGRLFSTERIGPESLRNTQHGGSHYKGMKIEPVTIIHENNLDFFQGTVLRYIMRHKLKGGAVDVKKAIHFCQMICEFQYGIITEVTYKEPQNERSELSGGGGTQCGGSDGAGERSAE